MPYIPLLERLRMAKEEFPDPHTVGDLNYLVTLDILIDFITEPRYHTIHNMYKKYVLKFTDYQPLWWTVGGIHDFEEEDFVAARTLAYMEFYDRIGRKYEDHAIAKNGDLDGYKDILKLLEQKEKEHANRSK